VGQYQWLQLWKSDGSSAGTAIVKNIPNNGVPSSLTKIGNMLFFTLYETNSDVVWRSDGTQGGTIRVQDVNGTTVSSVFRFVDVDGVAYFAGSDSAGHGVELWRSDGTPSGTYLVKDIHPTANAYPEAIVPLAPAVTLFAAHDGVHGYELWKTDGTNQNTQMLLDAAPGITTGYPYYNSRGVVLQ
jgi:ELWxxDGT repeat protein